MAVAMRAVDVNFYGSPPRVPARSPQTPPQPPPIPPQVSPTFVQMPSNDRAQSQPQSQLRSQAYRQHAYSDASSRPHSQSHGVHHRPSQPSVSHADTQLARALQREEEEAISERAIRAALTKQFAKAANRKVDDIDLSMLSLAEAQQAVEIQLKINNDKRRKGLLNVLKRKLSKKKSSSPHLAVNSSGDGRASPSPGSGERRSRSPSPRVDDIDNVDVDRMSYEELLALSEQIGDVKSKGLSEAEIDRLPVSTYLKPQRDGEQTPDDDEKKVDSNANDPPSLIEGEAEGQFSAEMIEEMKRQQKKKKKKRGLFARLTGKGKDKSSEQVSASTPQPPSRPLSASHSQPDLQSLSNPSAPLQRQPSLSSNHTCSICLEPFKHGDALKFLPCLHRAHAHEMDQWLTINASCPVCKEKVTIH